MSAIDREQRVAVVLAGTRGIGRACAEALAADDHAIVLCGRTEAAVADAAAAIEAAGGEAKGIVADVTDAGAVTGVVEAAVAAHGRLDVLVANSGGPPAGDFDDVADAQWEAAFRLTLMSVVVSVRAALPPMRERGRGRIVVIGSSSARAPLPGLVLSNAFRPALAGLVKSLAVTEGAAGITANLVCPGKVGTDRMLELDEVRARKLGRTIEEQRAATEAQIPAGRYGEPRELGDLVAFLASDDAAYLSGQTILLDGGLVPTLP